MPRLPRWTASDAERSLLVAGFELLRSKGSHRIYRPSQGDCAVPQWGILHPKIVKQGLEAIEEAAQTSASDE
jgi:predicted RNA binding protein YcfA (HicA-like mRNA interferase family)